MQYQISNIKFQIQNILKDLGIEKEILINLAIPTDLSHGDYTTNVAFIASKQLKKAPMQIAEEIVKKFKVHEKLKNIEKIEIAKPGFINFWLSKDYLVSQMNKLISDPENAGKTTQLTDNKIMVEFTDPNPFKEFHIGHVYTNSVGESISRILEANGATVWRADYFGDVGMHVAKSLWGLEQKFKEQKIDLKELEKKSLNERIKYLGQAYAKGSSAYEEKKDVQEEVKIINKLIYIAAQNMWQKEKNITPHIDYKKNMTIDMQQLNRVYELYTTGRKWSLEYFEFLYDRLGMKFDGYYPESIAGEKGYSLVRGHIQDGIFEEHDGAVVFRGEKVGLHTRVFINSLGLPTYEAKELGLAPWKYEDFPYDQSIIVTGNEIKEYFKVLIAAMTAIDPELGKKTQHLPHGMVRLPEGKMSSRTGKIITGEWLLEEAKKRAAQIALDKGFSSVDGKETINQGGEQSKRDHISEQVGIGAVKYALLKNGIGGDIEFDFDKSLSFEGNSGPYVQYTYVRTRSILNKVKSQKLKVKNTYQPEVEERTLLRQVRQFQDIVTEAGHNLAPNTLCSYLYELSKQFNLFYQKFRIVDAKTPEEIQFRVNVTLAVGIILKQGLSFLGIVAPERM